MGFHNNVLQREGRTIVGLENRLSISCHYLLSASVHAYTDNSQTT